jgi:competence protein ComEC
MTLFTLPRSERLVSPFLPIYAGLGFALGDWWGERLLTWGFWACQGAERVPSPLWLLAPLPFWGGLLVWGRRDRRRFIPLFVLVFVLLGAWRHITQPFEPCFQAHDLRFYHRAHAYGPPEILEGVIIGYPDRRVGSVSYRVRVDTIWRGHTPTAVTGLALVRTTDGSEFEYGDRLRIRGIPTTPPTFSDFDYRRYLARRGVHTLIRATALTRVASGQGQPWLALLYRVRARGSAVLNAILPEPYAALANGMILGIESAIPRELYAQFNLTGTSHVIVISGSNIALVSGILMAISRRWRRPRLAAMLTLTGIAFYTLLVGADAAVTRAALMGGLAVMAVVLGRQSAALLSLFLAGLVMLMIQPLTLWDVGFQLSFTATLGLILFSRPLQERWQAYIGRCLPRLANTLIAEGLLVTVAAQIATLPLIVAYFGRLSLIAFLTNLLILPVQPLILTGGGLAMLAGFFALPLAQMLAWIPRAALWWTVLIVEQTARVPFGSLVVGPWGRLLATLGFFGLGLGFIGWLLRQEQGATSLIPSAWQPTWRRSLILATAVILPLWGIMSYRESRPDGRLHLLLLGRGETVDVLIVGPTGRRMLIAAGRMSAQPPLADAVRSQPAGRRPLDLILLARGSADGCPLPTALCPDTVLSGSDALALPNGSVITLEEGVTLSLLYRPSTAEEMPLFLLRYGDFTALLPFELSQASQEKLLGHVPPGVTVLPAPFPGSGFWPHPDLIAHLHPQVVLVPEGVTYPPAVQRSLTGYAGLAVIAAMGVTEISSDGQTFTLLARPYPEEGLRR